MVKKAVKYIIDELELIYNEREGSKEKRLIELNILLDLVLFQDCRGEYREISFA